MSEVAPHPSGQAAAKEEMNANQVVIFTVGDEYFAVTMAPVQEIIRVPEIVRMPLAPPSLIGLANLRGKVLPIVSLRRLFAMPEKAHDDATRAIVVDVGQPIGFVVDRVISVVTVESEQIADVAELGGSVAAEYLTGVLKGVAGLAMVMRIDLARLIAQEFAAIAASAQRAAGQQRWSAVGDGTAVGVGEQSSDELQLVSFFADGQEYAVPIEAVREIVLVPDDVAHLPNVPPAVHGIITLRGRLLPLVLLRTLFGLSAMHFDEKTRVVVIGHHGMTVGLVVDSVAEVLRVPEALIEPLPAILHAEGLAEIDRICRLADGQRLVSIVDTEALFAQGAVQAALAASKATGGEEMRTEELHEQQKATDEEEEQVVVFQLAGNEFGVPIDCVQEIVRVPDTLTVVPKAPHFVEGVINLRGTVLPVIDQRKRFDLPEMARNERQRIIVYLLDGVRVGFIVDAVTEVRKIPYEAIEAAPALSAEQQQMIGRIAKLPGRMVQLINPHHLLTGDQHEQIAALTQG